MAVVVVMLVAVLAMGVRVIVERLRPKRMAGVSMRTAVGVPMDMAAVLMEGSDLTHAFEGSQPA